MTKILVIGSVLWDLIGRSDAPMMAGADRPGRITRQPGGVALNIAKALRNFGLSPVLLSAVGRDAQGDDLLRACDALELDTRHVHRADKLPTDRYMAIEASGDLIAAIADAHTLEAVGEDILRPILDGTLGSKDVPFSGTIVLDGNLTERLLQSLSERETIMASDVRVAPASPGKALRLKTFVENGNATLYVNLEEAELLAGTSFGSAADAASCLVTLGARRALVTNGPNSASDATGDTLYTDTPPQVTASQITGAGDMFVAAHIAAELAGSDRETSLSIALNAAARHISGD